MPLICGADGCKGGWVAVEENVDACEISWRVVPSLRDLATSKSTPQIIALDVPIGLPDKGSRACDLEARLPSAYKPAPGWFLKYTQSWKPTTIDRMKKPMCTKSFASG